MLAVMRRLPLIAALVLLGYAFWSSPTLSEIAAGAAVFLFGMMTLEQGLRRAAGGTLENLLRRSTDRLWKGLGFGAVATALTQSSTLVSLITISFLSAGLLSLGQGIGVIFGANLGTTTGAWLMAGPGMRFDIGTLALPLLTFGVVFILSRFERLSPFGWMLAGIGFLFLGIQWMKEGFEVFQQAFDLTRFSATGLTGLAIYTAIGILATIIMQSSHATLIVTIAALGAGQVTYENALAISIGANVGTALTTLVAGIAANVEGRRLAVAHVVFNLVTAAVALIFIAQFMAAVEWLTQRIGIAADSHALKLALFHTLFNVAGIALMVPFIDRLVGVLVRLLRGKPPIVSKARYINPDMVRLPAAALEAVRRELIRLFHRAFDLIARVLQFDPVELQRADDGDELLVRPERIHAIDVDAIYGERIKPLHGLIIAFLARVPVRGRRAVQAAELRAACQDLVEAVKHAKHLQKNLVRHLDDRNEEVRNEYLAIRARLGRVLTRLYALSQTQDGANVESTIDELVESIRSNDRVRGGHLDHLIRDHRISSENATSLMNDSAYAYRMSRNLLKMARVAFQPLPTHEEENDQSLEDRAERQEQVPEPIGRLRD